MNQPVHDTRKHFYWLDAIRFVAALLVVVEHSRGVIWQAYGDLAPDSQNLAVVMFFAMARLGTEAVVVFFVLSGLLVGGLGFERILRGTFDTQAYVVDRSVRLLLPLFPALLLTYAVNLITGATGHSWAGVLGNALFLQGIFVDPLHGNDPLWTLAYEFWFYFGLVAVSLLAGARLAGLILLMLLFLVFRYLHPVFLFIWLLGAAAYLVPCRNFPVWIALASVGLATLSIAAMQLPALAEASLPWLRSVHPALWLGFASALILLYLSEREPPGWIRPVERGLGRMGALSYTLYLTHFPLLSLFRHLFEWERQRDVGCNSLVVYLGLVTGLVAGAYLLYLLFESHTNRVKLYFKTRILSPKH